MVGQIIARLAAAEQEAAGAASATAAAATDGATATTGGGDGGGGAGGSGGVDGEEPCAAVSSTSGSSRPTGQPTGQTSGQTSGNVQHASNSRFSICVTGDHSTPVIFGDHSHEPVPFAVAHVRHALRAMGGARQLALRAIGAKVPLPNVKAPPPLQALLSQAAQQQRRREAAAAGRAFGEGGADDEGLGAWRETWPQEVLGDGVCAFDELSAARGGLGRFPGSQVMPLLKQFVGVVGCEE